MTITQMKKELAQMNRSLKSLVRSAGDDMGCDGTAEEAKALREGIVALEMEIREAQVVRNTACPVCQAMPGRECRDADFLVNIHASRFVRSGK
jgi:hypothetical protein